MTVDQFNECLDRFNALNTGIWLMGSHHEAEASDLMPEFESSVEVDYGLILLQSLKHLVIASDKLRETGYYDGFDSDEMAYIDRRKETLNAWNEAWNEKDPC